MTPRIVLVGLAVALSAFGCGDEGADQAPGGGDLGDGSAGSGPDPSTDFSLGVTGMGDRGEFQVRIDTADPAPPRKYENDWVVSVLDAEGEPAESTELFFVEPFMPTHGHDGTFEPTVTAGDEPGTFNVQRINLWMGGTWEVRFFLKNGDVEDRVVIDVFIED